MESKMKILLIVDMQNDFIDGVLGNEETRKVVGKVVDLIESEDWNYIVTTMDSHTDRYLDTTEGKYLPVKHCVFGTHGWQMNDDVLEAVTKSPAPRINVSKERFGCDTIGNRIQHLLPYDYNLSNSTVVICGVCTDISVISNVLLLKSYPGMDARICVKEDACAGTTPENHDAAMKVMLNCHVEVV